ncbi:MAG: helix-turn-helix domain-containing protein [Thiobacillaceae bacterium]
MKRSQALKPLQLQALQLLAMGTPANQVAERLEVTTMTLYRWRQLPAFADKLHSITHSGLEEIAKKMNATILTAVETLQEILCDMREPTQTKMKAALGVLNAMSAVNGALEKSLQHRVGDFDLKKRFSGPCYTYDSSGNPCRQTTVESMPDVVEV